jgi:chlorobactene lauroyltransferase
VYRKNMLEANKSRIFEKLFVVYNRNLLRRRFDSLQVSGLDFLFNKDANIPLIIYCNHSSWWDGLIAFQISYETGLESFIMMEEKQLRKLFFFRLLGAFSVVREKPREAFKSIEYAAGLLRNNSKNTLWIFPQGEILPNDLRPLKFYNGLAKIVQKVGKCSTISLSMRYEILGNFKPQVFVKIEQSEFISSGEDFDSKRLTEKLTVRLTESLDSLKQDFISQNFTGYQTIF